MIKLLAFDLDGTTITEHKYLSEENREALRLAAEQGVELVPTTGRMLSFLPPEIAALPGVRYAITSNGASVYELRSGKAVHQSLIPNEKAKAIQAVLEAYDIYVEYYKNGSAITKIGFPERAQKHFHLPDSRMHFVTGKHYTLVENFADWLAETETCPEKINFPFLEEPVRQELWEKLERLGGLRLTSSIPDNLEINDENAHKGAAVLALAKGLGISPEEIMTIGDNGNDVTMLEAGGCSVAVADGSPEALAAAKHIAAAHDQNGLAQAIHTYILHA